MYNGMSERDERDTSGARRSGRILLGIADIGLNLGYISRPDILCNAEMSFGNGLYKFGVLDIFKTPELFPMLSIQTLAGIEKANKAV